MRILILITALLIHFSSFSQKAYLKYGGVSVDELKMKKCAFYDGADAMVLGEIGNLKFNYDNDKGWQYIYTITVRKKIFNKTGIGQSNVNIRLYYPRTGGNRENVTALKAATYNLVAGKVEKTKLNNSDKFQDRINDYWEEVKFAMPNVKEGSVIEYKYEITSDYVTNLRTWYFQSDIPVAYSEFNFTIPEWFSYQNRSLGTVTNIEEKNDFQDETFLIEWRELVPGEGSIKHSRELNSNSPETNMIAKELLPIEEEPYMANKIDAPSRLEFQLVSLEMPGQDYKQFGGTYAAFNNRLLKHESFGLRLNNEFFAKDWVTSVEGKSAIDKAASILQKAKNHFVWDKSYGIWSDKAGRNAYTNKTGSVADINLSLVAAYTAAGLNAFPVVLSTRGHGTVHPTYPSNQDFNYVVAAVYIDDKLYLSDATSNNPLGSLPYRCLNDKGWMVAPNGQWVNLKADNKHKATSMTEMSIAGNQLISTCKIKCEKYAAIETSRAIKKDKSEFENEIKKTYEDWTCGAINYNEDNSTGTFKYNFELKKELEGDDIIYVQPFVDGVFLESPFNRESRTSNIDFIYNYAKKAIVIIKIPDGYTAELPESGSFKLPNGTMSFKYNAVLNNNTINVVSDFKIKQTDFSSSEYASLKEFFQMMVEKNNQVIVLKKS